MKRLLSLFAAILMASAGMWAETVDYLYPVYNTDGVPTSGIKEWKNGSANATVVTNSGNITWGTTGTTTWYVVTGADVVLSEGVICKGDVRLILADDAKLTAKGKDIYCDPGIQVSGEGNSLTIYGQTNQTGQLIANGDTYGAGIGGGQKGSGSNITINGGTITTTGATFAAGIGGGYEGSGSNITINGGTVTANGGQWAAGIGGGYGVSGSSITINGGNVTAEGEDGSDGIGNGANATTPSSDIFVATWCIVKAGSSITPSDVIENTGSDLATSLEGKQYVSVEPMKVAVTYGDNITVSPAFASGAEIAAGTQITFTAADRTADSYGFWGFYEESTFDTPITTGVNGQAYTVTVTDAAISVYARYGKLASYVYPVYNAPNDVIKGIEKWETGKVSAIEVTSSTEPVTWGEAGKTTWYVVTSEDVTLSQGAICYGDVRLILADGAKLTANGVEKQAGINVSEFDINYGSTHLTIYGQAAQSGQLVAKGGVSGAGIGGGTGIHAGGSYITINGGKVTANGGEDGAGIGGGRKGHGSNITINGGTVTANGGDYGAGIGGGIDGFGNNITINGGTVTATGETGAAGIGGGLHSWGNDITVNGGTVTATGGSCAAGIGGGGEGNGSFITINGGTVTANGGYDIAGIGVGYNAIGSSFGIFVANILTLKANDDVIENNGEDLARSLAGKQYVTVSDAICNITANQDPNNKANYYSTFYSGTKAYSVPSGVTAYTGVVDGDVLRLTAIEGGIIPAGEAVILRLTTEDNTATKKQFALTATTTTATKSTDNKLSGTDVAKTLGENEYALSLGQKGVGFYLWEDKSIDAHKAYLTLPASSAKAFTFQFEDETDGIQNCQLSTVNSQLSTYNLNGMRVGKDYKGIVIKNGKKVYQK